MSLNSHGAVGRGERAALRWLERLREGAEAVTRLAHARAGQGSRRPASGKHPLAVAGLAAGAGLILGAAISLRGKRAPTLDDPEEIVARALCREDPDTDTSRGPLWSGYRKDARRVLAALREAGFAVERV